MFTLNPDNYKIFVSTQLQMFWLLRKNVRDFVLNTKNYLPNPSTAVHLGLVIKSPGEFNKRQETSSNFMRFHDTWSLLVKLSLSINQQDS